jgi:SAM-dependent methyltransferase
MSSPLERDLVPRLRCLACGGRDHRVDGASVVCSACGRTLPIEAGVLRIRALIEDPAVVSERAAVLAIERERRLGDPGFGFDDILTNGALQRALLALPHDASGAATWGPYFQEVGKFAAAFDFVLTHFGVPAGGCVLDVGADLTWSTAQLARRGYRAIGIDINHHLAAAEALGRHGVPYAVAKVDMHVPAFGDGVFDGITAFNALHHSAKLDVLAANLARSLRTGGRLGVVEAYWFYPEARATFGVDQIAAGINENVYRLEEWHAALVRAGLELVAFAASRSFDAVYERTGRDGRTLAPPEAAAELFARYYDVRVSAPTAAVSTVPGASLDVPITLHNRSNAAWCTDSQVPVFASYHLLSGAGTGVIAFDNVRTVLPGYVAPGTDTRLALRVDAPAQPGRYRCEVDLVHEGVTWFKDRGGRTTSFDLTVAAP